MIVVVVVVNAIVFAGSVPSSVHGTNEKPPYRNRVAELSAATFRSAQYQMDPTFDTGIKRSTGERSKLSSSLGDLITIV